jgi:hypothetical protein
MRPALLFAFLLLLRVAALAAGTVGFNVNWYSTPGFPFNDIVGFPQFNVTTGVVIADFNRDGILDVAYSNACCENGSSGGSVVVKLGTGGGNLGPDIFTRWGGSSLSELATADISGDGWLDVVVRDPLSSCLLFLRGNGDGTFQFPSGVGCVGVYAASFTLGDFNHDGKIDLAEIGCDQQNGGFPFYYANCALSVFLGDGAGNFTQVQSIQLAGATYDLHSADLNGDGILDLAYVRGSVGVIRFGLGNGTFSSQIYLKPPTTDPMDAVAIADFNNDGRLDVTLLSGNPCRPDPDRGPCGQGNVNIVWMYKNNGGTSFTLTAQSQFTAQAGAIAPADINGDLNQDLLHYNPYASGIYPVLGRAPGFDYALGLGKDNLGTQGSLLGGAISAVASRDMNGDSRADYAVIDWDNGLAIGIQTGGYKNCPPPNSAKLAAKICGIKDGATVTSPVLVRASGNSPAGVRQMQVWIDGNKKYVKWGDQLSKRFTLSSGKHKIAVVANDRFIGSAKTIVNVTVP